MANGNLKNVGTTHTYTARMLAEGRLKVTKNLTKHLRKRCAVDCAYCEEEQ